MITLNHFNQLPQAQALRLLEPCVALPAWREALALERPYATLTALTDRAQQLMQHWGEADLARALCAHPRIGEKPTGGEAHAVLSRQEQAEVNADDAAIARALKEENARYEARFDRVFLIRAKGRSAAEILQALTQRLTHNDAQEIEAALEQLREITLLRLAGVISE
ncbi:TPA: 2-oxo-4-hydroxy-4-carboxy-5-ureidoimidazoline decarboxylase [Klebsiella aerogenes]|uniref:2-oxo-4-hydroxy-4-carboxy-5-ureidoimidazoline decarboxylase n=1 Tax=Klebsiella aerogenes TaxID=548 RepID=UPI00388D4887|nr:2-oxo-4-hydroxy-4-carboxy-5-ureidoimidazoline decarboxylase [Klebsiella aerogenes]